MHVCEFFNYGEEFLRCPCGRYSTEKAPKAGGEDAEVHKAEQDEKEVKAEEVTPEKTQEEKQEVTPETNVEQSTEVTEEPKEEVTA